MKCWAKSGLLLVFSRTPWLHLGAALCLAHPVAIRAATEQDQSALARQSLIKVWTTDQGLPGSDVTAIVQTRDRYLWLSTFDGLARFDGAKFTVFDRSNTPGLPSNAVVNMHL